MFQSRAPEGRRPRRVVLVAGALLGGVLAAGCSGTDAPSSSGGNIVEGTGVITMVPKEDRDPAPELTGLSTHDEELRLSDFRGQVVVLNVWGSWCGPCRAEAPNLATVSDDMADQGVQFLGINTRDPDKRNAVAFDRGFGITYPSFYDPKGRLILEFPANTLSPQSIPSTLVLDPDGDIAVRALKPLTEEELRSMIDPVLEESDGAEPVTDASEEPGE